MITPEILRPVIGGDLLDWARPYAVSESVVEVRCFYATVLDKAKQRVKKAGFHVYALPDVGRVHRFRVRQRAHK